MVECQLPKLKVAGSNPVSRSKQTIKTPVADKAAGVFCVHGLQRSNEQETKLAPQFHSHTQLAHDLLDPVLRGRKDPVKNIFLDGYAALKGKDAVDGFRLPRRRQTPEEADPGGRGAVIFSCAYTSIGIALIVRLREMVDRRLQ